MIAGQQLDAAPEGDMMWKGVNARLHPALLSAGQLSLLRNGRCTDGKPKPRKGMQLLPWTNPASSGSAVPLAITGLQGVGVFADPDDRLWMIYAANGVTYYCGPNNAARIIALPAGVSLAGQDIEFVQCNERLIMLRGPDQPELQLSAVTEPWQVIPQMTNDPAFADENPSDGTETIPPAPWGLALQNRLLLPNASIGTDVLSMSDYFNYTRYQPTLSSFRINQGDAGALIGVFEVPTPDDTPASAILVFKDDPSIHLVSGIIGDLSGLARQTVTREYTAANRKAVWRVGRDVWFVAAGHGVASLQQSEQNKWQGVEAPVSRDIQPLIDRINWGLKDTIRGVKVGNFSYIAVPLDDGRFLTDLIGSTATYTLGSYTVSGLTIGRTYRFTPGNAAGFIAAGVVYTGEQDWVATATSIEILANAPGEAAFSGDIGEAIANPGGDRCMVLENGTGLTGLYITSLAPARAPELNSDNEMSLRPYIYVAETGLWYRMDISDSPFYTAAVVASGTVPAAVRAAQGVSPLYVTAQLQLITSDVNNTILVYDHLNDAWAGYDTGISVQEFLTFNYQGVDRLFIFRNGGFFGLYEETSRDQLDGTNWRDIDFMATTRGYALRSELGRIRVKDVRLQLKTWGPRYSIDATLDGANETQSIASAKIKSRTRYYRPFTKPRWLATNVNLDHGTKFREDYSPDLSSDVYVSDMNFDLYQETTETYHCPKGTRGQYVTFSVSNDRGRAELHGVMLDAVKVDNNRRGVKV